MLGEESVKGNDFDPVGAFAGRVTSDRLQRASGGVDCVRRNHIRQLARHDDEAAGRVDIEAAGLLLRRRTSDVSEFSARGIDAKGRERARCALRGVEKVTVRCEVKSRPFFWSNTNWNTWSVPR